MNAGDTFRHKRHDKHLWIVLSDPRVNQQEVLLVNMTTWRADKDQACLLNPGDHEEVEHNSCINYEDARVCSESHLNHLELSDSIVLCPPLKPDVLARVRAGAAQSTRITIKHYELLVEQELIEE